MRYGIWGLQEEQYIVSCLGMPPAEPFLLMRCGKLGLQEQYGMPSLFNLHRKQLEPILQVGLLVSEVRRFLHESPRLRL